MFGLGHTELLIILVIGGIIFGARKLPEIGSGLGGAIRDFRKSVSTVEDEIRQEPENIEAEHTLSFAGKDVPALRVVNWSEPHKAARPGRCPLDELRADDHHVT